MSKQFQFKLVLLGMYSPCRLHKKSLIHSSQVSRQLGSPGQGIAFCCGSVTQPSCNSLVLRFVKDQFDDYRESTIGGMLSEPGVQHSPLTRLSTAAFLTQTVTLDDQTTVKFEIWYILKLEWYVSITHYSIGIPQVKNDTRYVGALDAVK